MNIKIDPLTGEEYDADVWYRANGLWHNIEAEKEYYDRVDKVRRERWATRNASRVAKGKKVKSMSCYRKAAERYEAWLREDSGRTFGEFLKDRKNWQWH